MSDFLIIYLACGAPCGVYFFLQNRKKLSAAELWLKSFLTVIVWIPYAFKLLHDFATKKAETRNFNKITASEKRLSEIQKLLLDIQNNSSIKFSLFEFREILERYAGLTNSCNFSSGNPQQNEREIFRVALRQNIELGANCLHRRNRERLLFHQTLARKDFLQIISKLSNSVADAKNLKSLAFELVEILKDVEARKLLERIFDETLQSERNIIVKDLEKDVWKSKEQKRLPANQMPIHLQTMTATASNKKD